MKHAARVRCGLPLLVLVCAMTLGSAEVANPPADPAIAFVKGRGVYVMNADGSNPAEIYQAGRNETVFFPCWAPDGGAIAFVKDNDLWRLDVRVVGGVPRGMNLVLLVDSGPSGSVVAGSPDWSPLGGEIAFADPTTRTIEVVPATGGPRTVLQAAPMGTIVESPSWSPDGSRLAFRWRDSSVERLVILDRATLQTTVALTVSLAWTIHNPEWSRVGDRVVFNLDSWSAPLTRRVQIIDLATSSVTDSVPWGWLPSWSPDDATLLIVDQTSNTNQRLATVDLATGVVTQFGNATRAGRWPHWRRF